MLTITQVSQVKVKVTVRKTEKSYYRTMNYAKLVTRAFVGEPKEKAVHEYFLREGRGWKKVAEEEFKKATSKEAVRKLHEQLERELRQRVEQIMSKT